MFRQNSSRRCTRGRRWWVVASSRMRWPPTPVRSPLPRRRPPTARLALGRSVAQGAREGEADVPSQATRRGTRPNTTDTANPPRRSRTWLRIRCRNASDGTANTHHSILWPPSRRTNSAATVTGRLTRSRRRLDTCARARQRKRQRSINRDSVRFNVWPGCSRTGWGIVSRCRCVSCSLFLSLCVCWIKSGVAEHVVHPISQAREHSC